MIDTHAIFEKLHLSKNPMDVTAIAIGIEDYYQLALGITEEIVVSLGKLDICLQ
jgi:hypothetical protein